jgi:hypothetical protein
VRLVREGVVGDATLPGVWSARPDVVLGAFVDAEPEVALRLVRAAPDGQREAALAAAPSLAEVPGARELAWELAGRRAPGWRALWPWIARA